MGDARDVSVGEAKLNPLRTFCYTLHAATLNFMFPALRPPAQSRTQGIDVKTPSYSLSASSAPSLPSPDVLVKRPEADRESQLRETYKVDETGSKMLQQSDLVPIEVWLLVMKFAVAFPYRTRT